MKDTLTQIVDTVVTIVKEPVTLVNAGALAVSLMDIEVFIKIGIMTLTGIWTILKIVNEWKIYKANRNKLTKIVKKTNGRR